MWTYEIQVNGASTGVADMMEPFIDFLFRFQDGDSAMAVYLSFFIT